MGAARGFFCASCNRFDFFGNKLAMARPLTARNSFIRRMRGATTCNLSDSYALGKK
jgi:hypothetical protein